MTLKRKNGFKSSCCFERENGALKVLRYNKDVLIPCMVLDSTAIKPGPGEEIEESSQLTKVILWPYAVLEECSCPRHSCVYAPQR